MIETFRGRPGPNGAATIALVTILATTVATGLIDSGASATVQAGEAERSVPERADVEIRFEVVAAGLEAPLFLTGDGTGDRYVVEQRGTIRRLDQDGVIADEPLLDIRDRVLHHHERGLLGLAFHPAFAANGRLFVLYSRAADGATSLSEFTAPVEATAGGRQRTAEESERPLLVIPATSTLHKGGMLAFDRDGMLLAGVGDGSTGNDPEGRAQDRSSLQGKLLRLDVDGGDPYAIPPDNGFAGDGDARGEVHALGLRNPWRFSLDPATGHVYIGDVGQGAWEEIDVLAPGVREPSFGWAEMEGRGCFYGRACDPGAHIEPVIAYSHVDGEIGHCGVIGGYAYRGQAGSMPAGTYLYADYCSGTIWAVPAEQLQAGSAVPVLAGRVPPAYGQARSFGQDDDGELYLLTAAGYVLALSSRPR